MKGCMFVELKVALIRNGLNYVDVSTMLKISPSCFSAKMRGARQWKLDEIYKLCKVLKLPTSEIDKYFPERNV